MLSITCNECEKGDKKFMENKSIFLTLWWIRYVHIIKWPLIENKKYWFWPPDTRILFVTSVSMVGNFTKIVLLLLVY